MATLTELQKKVYANQTRAMERDAVLRSAAVVAKARRELLRRANRAKSPYTPIELATLQNLEAVLGTLDKELVEALQVDGLVERGYKQGSSLMREVSRDTPHESRIVGFSGLLDLRTYSQETNQAIADIKGVSETLKASVKSALEVSLALGEGDTPTMNRIMSLTEPGSPFRVAKVSAEQIARTASNSLVNVGKLAAYTQYAEEFPELGIVNEWVNVSDFRTSDVCAALVGQKQPPGVSFSGGGWSGTHPPAHVNCRSTLIPVIGEPPKTTQTTQTAKTTRTAKTAKTTQTNRTAKATQTAKTTQTAKATRTAKTPKPAVKVDSDVPVVPPKPQKLRVADLRPKLLKLADDIMGEIKVKQASAQERLLKAKDEVDKGMTVERYLEVEAALAEVNRLQLERAELKKKALAEFRALLDDGVSKHTVHTMKHGMSKIELHYNIEIDGVRFHAESTAPDSPLVTTLLNVVEHGELPPALMKHTSDVYFTAQGNKDDEHWRRVYKNFTVSGATGGDGGIVVYNGKPTTVSTIAHEAGHNLARAKYATTHPPKTTEYAKDYAKNGAVSEYAKNNVSEDFADAVKLYVLDPGKLKSDFPVRYKIINEMIGSYED